MNMELQKVFSLGHSHLGALSSAYENVEPHSGLTFELTRYQFLRVDRPHIVHVENRGWCYNQEIERDILDLLENTKPAAVAILLQGEQAVSSGLIAPVRPYDFFFPQEVGYIPDPNSEIIPFDIIFNICKNKFRLIADFLDLIVDRLPPIAFALCPPPIVGDTKFILNSDTSHEGISSHIAKFGLPSTSWRLRVWKVHVMALRAVYTDRKIAFIDPPAESFGEDGCLRTEFRSDVFHANAAYGQLLLNQINRLVEQQLR
jgi:hypothetical protein